MEWQFVVQLMAAALAGMGYALLYNVHGKLYIPAVLGAMLGWGIYVFALQGGYSTIGASFAASVVISLWSEILSRLHKAPATVFLVIGVLPLVPGGGIYSTMRGITTGDLRFAMEKGLETIGIALVLALGMLIVSTIVRLYYSLRGKNFHLPRRV